MVRYCCRDNVQHLTFDLFSPANTLFNTSHHVSTLHRLFFCCLTFTYAISCDRYETLSHSIFVTDILHFIESKYTLIFTIINNHKPQYHLSSNCQHKLFKHAVIFKLYKWFFISQPLEFTENAIWDYVKLIFKLESYYGIFTFLTSYLRDRSSPALLNTVQFSVRKSFFLNRSNIIG